MKNLFLLVIALTCLNVFAFPSKEEVLIFADLLDEHLLTRKDNLRYNDARLLEFLLYKDRIISKSLESSNHYYKKFSGERRLNIYKDSKKIVYKRGYNGRKLTIEASFKNNKVTFSISKRRDSIVKDNVIDMTSLDEDYFELISQKIYDIVQMRKGYDGFQAQNNVALNAKGDVTLQDSTEGKSTLLRIKEKVIRDSNYDNNEWKYVPIKLVSYPAQKIMYEIPELFTGLAIESVTRSPLHNIQGAGDEAKGAGKSFLNGFKDLFRGIVKPKKASSIDGLLTIVDGGFKVVKAGVNVAKSAISIVGYPLYRIFGGKKSKRVPLRGKRATVVVIDTGIDGGTVDDIVDTYGETIIRNQLKSISSYYCLNSNAEPNNIENCIDQMPDDIEYVDFFALTHSGGDSMIERLAIYAAETKGVKPELMVSIGCYDDPSFLVEKENTVGQEATSWAVHYYLSNLISKRLRGIPMEVAANEAFYGAMPVNAVNPISLGAVGVVGAMEGDLKLGYFGSKPDLLTSDKLAKAAVQKTWVQVARNYRDFNKLKLLKEAGREVGDLAYIYNSDYKTEDALVKANKKLITRLHDLLEKNSDNLSKESLKILRNSKELEKVYSDRADKVDTIADFISREGEDLLNKDTKEYISIYSW